MLKNQSCIFSFSGKCREEHAWPGLYNRHWRCSRSPWYSWEILEVLLSISINLYFHFIFTCLAYSSTRFSLCLYVCTSTHVFSLCLDQASIPISLCVVRSFWKRYHCSPLPPQVLSGQQVKCWLMFRTRLLKCTLAICQWLISRSLIVHPTIIKVSTRNGVTGMRQTYAC